MKLIVKNTFGETVSIQIKADETFIDLKERVEDEAGISLDLKDIALKGRKIHETQKVMEYFLSYGKTGVETEIDTQPPNVYCAVPGCKNTKQNNPGKVFFEFPTEEVRCHQWVLSCQRLYAGQGKKRLCLTAESTVCSDHFRSDQFVKNTDTLLKRTAVPCVKMTPHDDSSTASNNSIEKPKSSLESSMFYDTETKNYFSEESQDNSREDILRLRLCRLCACACQDYILIYGDLGRELKIAEKINLCLPVEVQMTDVLPKQICRLCLSELNELFELADMSTLSQERMIYLKEENTSTEGLTLFSLDETGDAKDLQNSCCPLCKEGKMTTSRSETEEAKETSSFLNKNINESDPIVSSVSFKPIHGNRNENIFVSDISNRKLFVNSPSELDSQLDRSNLGEFSKDNDSLRHYESSKSDNDQIAECYSSLTSPLNLLNSDDSALKNIRDTALSPIQEELSLDPDFYSFDTLSETSSTHPSGQDTQFSNINIPLECRICALEFHSSSAQLKHSYSHSCARFYQCTICVSVYNTKEELDAHFSSHQEEDKNFHFCEDCSKTFTTAISLASHICKTESVKCPMCSKYFRTESSLRYHMKFHENDDKLFCKICNKVFSDEIKLQKHNWYIHNNKKTHRCEECGKIFKSEASMKYHQKIHQCEDGVRPFACERCGKTFIRKSMLINHMTSSHKHVIHDTPCFTCKICFEAFPSTSTAVSHMDNHHKLECMDETTYSFEVHTVHRLFMCEFCERSFAEGNVLNNHREQQHPSDAPYECKICGARFSTAEDTIEHRSEHLNDELPAEYLTEFTIPRPYLCEYCERCFLNRVKYTEHLTVHYGPEPYQCKHCSSKFSSLSEAVEHRSTHGSCSPQAEEFNYYRPYECHYCSKTFAIEDALVKHIRMHTGEKPFICDQCGKGFSQSSGLYTHQKVHSTERPYACPMCPRTFKIKGDRDVHVRKHSGDRPYKCEFCGKAFMTQHVYSQHRKIHTGERPYKCDVCGVAFRRSHVLTVHKRIHTGEKPNECDQCGKRYRQKGDMLKHRRVQHGIGSSNLVTSRGAPSRMAVSSIGMSGLASSSIGGSKISSSGIESSSIDSSKLNISKIGKSKAKRDSMFKYSQLLRHPHDLIMSSYE